ncbi:MAG: hypothetical protein WC716_04270 [Chitinophagaceae bacterium]|jgi:hypothetical protein
MGKILDCLIIGAGPAGLAAGKLLSQSNTDFLIIDNGDYLYNRNPQIPKDIVTGIGGGGLYSDGKISFYPSGSSLYKLNSDILKDAYIDLQNNLSQFSIKIPDFNPEWQTIKKETDEENITLKEYQSIVLSERELSNLAFFLYDQIGKDRFLVKTKVLNVHKGSKIYTVSVSDNENRKSEIQTRNIIYCAGKFGSKNLSEYLKPENLIFKKFEVGIRIETDHDDFDYKEYKQTDLKLLINKNKDVEFRTFCFCRNGYIVHGKFEELDTYNGVSNKISYSKTNFGINLRINNEDVYRKYSFALNKLMNKSSVISQSLKSFLDSKNEYWDSKVYDQIRDCILKTFPKLSQSNAQVTGPSFEYFGYYPSLTDELKVEGQNFWVSGDSTGDFRGLMPALVSGSIAALSLIKKQAKEKASINELVRIKTSHTSKTTTIFTAQSKKFFYCKDAICEFVFTQGCIPVNPFQAFGYFLNDRVARDLVRKGNNELISRCDELWVFGSIADGVLFEISRAYDLKIPVKFFTIETYSNQIEEITDPNKLVFEPEVYAQIGKEKLIKFIEQSYDGEIKKSQLLIEFDGLKK